MTQAQWLLLLLKITLLSGITCLLAWVAVYTWLTRWKWARNPVGRSIVFLALLSAASMGILASSLFINFGPVAGEVAGWVYVAVIGLTTPAMLSRIIVFLRLHRAERLPIERATSLEAENAALRTENARLRERPGEP